MRRLSIVLVLVLMVTAPAWAQGLRLDWIDNATNEDGFKIERRDGPIGSTAPWGQIATVGTDVVTYADVDALLVVGAEYCYQIRAFNTAGDSAYSNTACGIVGGVPPLPGAPSALQVMPISATFAVTTFTYDGLLRDQVGAGDTALVSDGSLDGTFTVGIAPGSGTVTVTELSVIDSVDPLTGWNTVSPDGLWVLGMASGLDAPLDNAPDASVNIQVADGGTFVLFASDGSLPGRTVQLTVTLLDGTVANASVTIP